MSLIKFALPSLLLFLAFPITSVSAQSPGEFQPTPREHRPEGPAFEISDAEMEKFANAATKMEKLRKESRDKRDSIISKYDMTLNEYRRKSRIAEDPTRRNTLDKEEIDQLKSFGQELQELQIAMDKKMRKEVSSTGLDMQRYQQIISAMQRDQDLRSKIESLLEES